MMKRTVLITTTLVAYSTSPWASSARMGSTANIGVADWTTNVWRIRAGRSKPVCNPNLMSKMRMTGDKTKRPNKARIESRSNLKLFKPASRRTIPM